MGCFLSARWLIGNKAQNDSYKALFGTGQIENGLDLLDKAVEWGPQPSEVRAVRSSVMLQLGRIEEAAGDAIWVAREYNYSGYGALESADLLFKVGYFEDSLYILNRVVENNSNNSALVTESYELMAAIYRQMGS